MMLRGRGSDSSLSYGPEGSKDGNGISSSSSRHPFVSKDRLLADVAVYERSLENVACSSSGEEGAEDDVEVVESVSNSSWV